MGDIKRRYILRESERKIFLKKLFEAFNVDRQVIGDKPRIEVAELDGEKRIFIIDGKPLLAEMKDFLIPTLMFEEMISYLPKVVVDMGAVPHICNGADIMAPGVVRIDGEFKAGDLAVVLDEKHGKAIAIARALVDSDVARSLKHGKAFKNLHYVGDPLWRILKDVCVERKS